VLLGEKPICKDVVVWNWPMGRECNNGEFRQSLIVWPEKIRASFSLHLKAPTSQAGVVFVYAGVQPRVRGASSVSGVLLQGKETKLKVWHRDAI
jgi:hypothetical protein